MTAEPASEPPPRERRVLGTLAKVLLSATLLAWVLGRVDLDSALERLTHPHFGPLAVALTLTFLQWPVTGARWHLLLRSLEAPLSLRQSLSAQLAALLMSQALPTVGGDAWRVVAVRRFGGSWRAGLASVLLDRLFALLALVLLVAGTHPWAHVPPGPTRTLTNVGLVATAAAILVAFFADWLLSPLRRFRIVDLVASTSGSARAVFASGRAAGVLALSVIAHVLTGAAVYCLALAFDVHVSLVQAVALMPPVVLLAALPISLAGWGVREGSMVAFFAPIGVPSESALTLSLALGLALLVSALPGAIVLVYQEH